MSLPMRHRFAGLDLCFLLTHCEQPEGQLPAPAPTAPPSAKRQAPASEQLRSEFPLFPLVERRRWQALLAAEAAADFERSDQLAQALQADFPFDNQADSVQLGLIRYHQKTRQFTIPAETHYPKSGDKRHPGELELILCSPLGRSHETLFLTKARPLHLELLLLLTGYQKYSPQARFHIEVLTGAQSTPIPIEALLRTRDGSPLPTPLIWEFSGSDFQELYSPDQTGDFALCWHAHDSVLRITNPDIASDQTKLLPIPHPQLTQGQPVTLRFTPTKTR